VPSCEEHNLDNSPDVEYVRNAVSIQAGTNAAAEEAFEVAKRSWKYSPSLFRQTFQELRPTLLDGAEVGIFPCDLDRLRTVMVAIAHALAYRDFGREYVGLWRVFCSSLHPDRPSPQRDRLRGMLDGARYINIPTPVPAVFTYGIHRMRPRGFIYKFVFYGGFVVYAWPFLGAQGGV
jgi:hypothetical protein